MTTNSEHHRNARKFAHLTSGTNILRATGESAWLHSVVINIPAAGDLTIYNNGAASGDIFFLTSLTTGNSMKKPLPFDVRLNNGLTVVLGATMDITVIYE